MDIVLFFFFFHILSFIQLEKLLQKNYFLHNSAKDGFRAYLQSYASYSLKKIFDVNQLDLAKVGKAFGFAVPPRVNVNVGPGRGTSNATNKKRRREEGGGGDEESEQVEEEEEVSRKDVRRENKQRRIEVEGRKKVGKEMYKKGQARQRLEAAGQWSR
jgi:ATP-dependent RNA helicase DDX18/HAS1